MKNEKAKRIIFILFFLSGISGLIYEVVWLRIISRIIGVTTYATATILAAFMAGLAVGSFIFGKYVDKRKNPLKIYALLQLSIAVIAVIMPVFFKTSLSFYKYVYEISNQNASLLPTVRVFVSFILLLLPTTMMGGTLPVLTSYMVKSGRLFGKNFSLLYGLNTLGAVFGVILSGFVTICTIGEWNTVFIGVTINCIVGIMAFTLHKKAKHRAVEGEYVGTPIDIPISPYPVRIRKMVLVSIMISGFTALAYEVIWTRQLILFLKNSIYSFSGMLAIFLAGIALGSIFINKYVDKFKTPLIIFGTLELAIGIISIFNLHLLLPLHKALYPFYTLSSPLNRGLLWNYLAPIILVFPLTFIFGAILPIASLCYTRSTEKCGSSVGMLYSFNTVGNVLGALLTGFLFISLIGSSNTIILLSFVNVALGFLLLWSEPNKTNGFKIKHLLIIPGIVFLWLGFGGKDPFLNVIEEKIKRGAKSYEIFYNRESVEGTVTSYVSDDKKGLMINGVWEASRTYVTKLLAHLPVALAENPKKALIICFGTGTTAKSMSIYDGMEITSVELVPDLYKCFKYYHPNQEEILKSMNLVSGDGRNFLLLSSDRYDIITVDPSYPIYSAGTVNLYTQEFISLCKKHLTPNGVMCLRFPGGTQIESAWALKTFYSVFPNMTVWNCGPQGGWLLIGTLKAPDIDKSRIEKAFSDRRVVEDFSEYGDEYITGSQAFELLFWGGKEKIEKEIEGIEVVTDNFPYLEFPLWRYLLGSPEDGSRRYKFSIFRK